MSLTVKHTPQEIFQCHQWAMGMLEALDGNKLRNDVRGCGTMVHQQVAGKLGEVAVGRLLGLPVSFDNVSDGGKDFTLPDGRTIDVKGTGLATAKYLIWPATKPLSIAADVLVGTVVHNITFDSASTEVHGYVARDEYDTYFERSSGFNGLVKNTRFGFLKDLHDINSLAPITQSHATDSVQQGLSDFLH